MDCVMNTTIKAAPYAATAQNGLRDKRIARNLALFRRNYRTQVSAVAARHRALADLAVSFPALLFVAAVPHRGVDREHLQQMIIAGHSLKTLAGLAGLPLWTRALRPDAFTAPIGPLPNSGVYARQIANHLPHKKHEAAEWLSRVTQATRWGDEAFAVWVAREMPSGWHGGRDFNRLILWAWFSLRPHLAGHKFVKRLWTPAIKRANAMKAAADFAVRLNLHVTIADAAVEPLWLPGGVFDGYDFIPLLDANALHAESDAMDNCVRSYGWDISQGDERLWSMCKDGKRVASLSVGFDYDLQLLRITQIKGRKNTAVPREVAIAAQRWFNSVDTTHIAPAPADKKALKCSQKAWLEIMKPYFMAKRGCLNWLPLAPDQRALDRL
jgi:hypothetical protein